MKFDLAWEARDIECSVRDLTSLVNIIIDDLDQNGEIPGRREMTLAALRAIRNSISLLADQQEKVADTIEQEWQEERA